MKRSIVLSIARNILRSIVVISLCGTAAVMLMARLNPIGHVYAQTHADWSQWGRTAQHNGATAAVGQSPNTKLDDITFDPFVPKEQAEEGGELLAHYQAPLVDGNSVFLESKTGAYVSCNPPGSGSPFPCGPDAWNSEIWNERAYTWQSGSLVQLWNFQSDWKPEPNTDPGDRTSGLGGWEPVFHAALGGGFVYVPGFSGSIYKLNETDGSVSAHITPFGSDPNTFVSGPLTIDHSGNVYYNVIVMDANNPWTTDVAGAWLVKVGPQGSIRKVSFATLVPGAPTTCGNGAACGSQRPGINVAPVVSNDGKTVYTVSRAHFFANFAYLVAANANLTPQWQTSMRGQIGPNISGQVYDISSSTPAVAPDDSILFGALGGTAARGFLMQFSASGQYLASYDFGWDETPAIYSHDGTYSVILKDNHYFTGGPYYITQLDSSLKSEWKFTSPDNFEWCVNAPAVDSKGTVYANSEDGNVYVINQGGTLKGKIFLRLAIGAAYTPIAIGRDGKLYTENDGDMFVVGN